MPDLLVGLLHGSPRGFDVGRVAREVGDTRSLGSPAATAFRSSHHTLDYGRLALVAVLLPPRHCLRKRARHLPQRQPLHLDLHAPLPEFGPLRRRPAQRDLVCLPVMVTEVQCEAANLAHPPPDERGGRHHV
eukprot:13847274-Heterocapsa_arctica.AAC.1